MFQFVEDIGSFLQSVVDFIVSGFQQLIQLFSFLISLVRTLPGLFGFLPLVIQVPVACFAAYMVIRTIINKGDN